MRRVEIQAAVAEVLNLLKQTGLAEPLQEQARAKAERFDPELLGRLKDFAIGASRLSQPARAILEIMDLRPLEDAQLWAQLMTGESPMLWHMSQNIVFAQNHLPKMLSLLVQRGVDAYVKSVEKGRTSKEGFEVLSVLVLEEESQFSRPQRLIEVLQAGELLYENCALLLGESPDRLTVLTCDSGSDKSFDLLGIAKVIQQVKEVIIALWDKVVFFKEKKFAAEVDAITHGLGVIAKVNEMESTGKLDPAQAELIRRGLANGCQKFLSAGAIIPEIRDHSHHNPRVLMAPEQKLLMPAAADHPKPDEPTKPPGSVAGSPTTEEMNERVRRLEELLAKQGSQSADAPEKSVRRKRKRSFDLGENPPSGESKP